MHRSGVNVPHGAALDVVRYVHVQLIQTLIPIVTREIALHVSVFASHDAAPQLQSTGTAISCLDHGIALPELY